MRQQTKLSEWLFCHYKLWRLTWMLGQQYVAFVISEHRIFTVHMKVLTTHESVCTCVCISDCQGLSSTLNGLMGALWCLSSPPGEGHTQGVMEHKGAAMSLEKSVFVARGHYSAGCCWPHGDYPSQGVCIVANKSRTSPLHPSCCAAIGGWNIPLSINPFWHYNLSIGLFVLYFSIKSYSTKKSQIHKTKQFCKCLYLDLVKN